MARITGRIKLSVNGKTLLNKAGAKASGLGLSGEPTFELTEVLGDTGLHGCTEKPVVALCEVTITDRDDIKLDDLARINGTGTLIFEAAGGGKVYTMTGVYCKRNFTLTGGEGEVSVSFIGSYWTEDVNR